MLATVLVFAMFGAVSAATIYSASQSPSFAGECHKISSTLDHCSFTSEADVFAGLAWSMGIGAGLFRGVKWLKSGTVQPSDTTPR